MMTRLNELNEVQGAATKVADRLMGTNLKLDFILDKMKIPEIINSDLDFHKELYDLTVRCHACWYWCEPYLVEDGKCSECKHEEEE